MELKSILDRIDAVTIPPNAVITQLAREEDDSLYRVWKIDTGHAAYVLKEAKEKEPEIYQTLLAPLKESVPALYQVIPAGDQTYLLMEYIEGENLCKCDRAKLTQALDALISLQKQTWEGRSVDGWEDSFEESILHRRNRGHYLNDPLLEEAYGKFMRVYESVPKALCHDDLLPFNILSSEQKAVLIDWESGGILPYPTSFARLIAHVEEDENALFYMTQSDRDFAIDYYYEHLLGEKGISREAWRTALEYFLFYEYCEWVFVGNKYQATDGAYYQKYLPMARRQAAKLLSMEDA